MSIVHCYNPSPRLVFLKDQRQGCLQTCLSAKLAACRHQDSQISLPQCCLVPCLVVHRCHHRRRLRSLMHSVGHKLFIDGPGASNWRIHGRRLFLWLWLPFLFFETTLEDIDVANFLTLERPRAKDFDKVFCVDHL